MAAVGLAIFISIFRQFTACCLYCGVSIVILILLSFVMGRYKTFSDMTAEAEALEIGRKKVGDGPLRQKDVVVETEGMVLVRCPNCGKNMPEELMRCPSCRELRE